MHVKQVSEPNNHVFKSCFLLFCWVTQYFRSWNHNFLSYEMGSNPHPVGFLWGTNAKAHIWHRGLWLSFQCVSLTRWQYPVIQLSTNLGVTGKVAEILCRTEVELRCTWGTGNSPRGLQHQLQPGSLHSLLLDGLPYRFQTYLVSTVT